MHIGKFTKFLKQKFQDFVKLLLYDDRITFK